MVLVQVLNFWHAGTGFTHAHTPHTCWVFYVHGYKHSLWVHYFMLQSSVNSIKKIIAFKKI